MKSFYFYDIIFYIEIDKSKNIYLPIYIPLDLPDGTTLY